jgi:hypothetical protein
LPNAIASSPDTLSNSQSMLAFMSIAPTKFMKSLSSILDRRAVGIVEDSPLAFVGDYLIVPIRLGNPKSELFIV